MKGPGYVAQNNYTDFETPSKALYCDINDSTILPYMSVDMVTAHGQARGFTSMQQVIKDYKEEILEFIRHFKDESDDIFIYGKCKASMRSQFHNFVIILNKNGTIKNSQCDCVAWAGGRTFCRHRAIAMYGLAELRVRRISLVEATSFPI